MRIIILNGSVNAGKTTTGKALAAILPGAQFIDGDDHGVSRSVPFQQMTDLSLDWLIDQIADAEAHTLVIARPLRDTDYARLQPVVIARGAQLIVVTLAPPLAVVSTDRGDRQLDAWERNRIQEMYAEGYASRAFSDLIITEVTTPALTARQIAAHFHLDAGQ
jgi:hypothetical protein